MANKRHTSMFIMDAGLEPSPAESFLTDPAEEYTSLFADGSASSSPLGMNPLDIMTPESFVNDDDKTMDDLTALDALDALDETESPGFAGSDKKTTKKRKSWGQVLPEPKTNLPPRKRAKTADEKEQRRVERVLRNRRAAQSSRERKRLEVEALEERTKKLEEQLDQADQANKLLMEELHKLRSSQGLPPFSANSLLVQQQPLSRHDDTTNNNLVHTTSTSTINPASITPDMTPIADLVASFPLEKVSSAEARDQPCTPVSDMAQHPAAMLSDLQCQSETVLEGQSPASRTSIQLPLGWLLLLRTMLLSASATLLLCRRPLMQIAGSLRANFSLRPSPLLLATIIWLVTHSPVPQTKSGTLRTSSTTKQMTLPLTSCRQNHSRRTSPTSRTTFSDRGVSTLRLRLLRKITSSSPGLARPLLDATLVALRLVCSEGPEYQQEILRVQNDGLQVGDGELLNCLTRIDLPSREGLLAMAWSLKLELPRQPSRIPDESLKTTILSEMKQPLCFDDQSYLAKLEREDEVAPRLPPVH